jgi:hypothetical protein
MLPIMPLSRNKKITLLFLALVILVSIPSVMSLFHHGFFQSDDGEWMIIRFSAFHQALRDGEFPVRWLGRLNYEYGYPVSNFLYPGFMYLSEPIKILGFKFVDTIKILIGLSLIASFLFCFLWLSNLFNRFSALVGSLYYLYLPYHLFDVYKRGSVGEVLALSFVTFILWMIEKKNLFFISVGLCLLILSHNTLALLFYPILFFYSVLRRKLSLKRTLIAFLVGVLLSSFFSLPAIFDLSSTVFSKVSISNPSGFFASFDLISIASVIALLTSLFLTIKPSIRRNFNPLTLFFILVAFISIFLSSSLSFVLWRIIPSNIFQFPFRFLSLELLALAYLVAFEVDKTTNWRKFLVGLVLIFLLFGFSYKFLTPQSFFDKGEGFYATNEATTTVKDEYMPKWLSPRPSQSPKNKIDGNTLINNLAVKVNRITFSISSSKKTNIRLNTAYFPGWNVYIDGKRGEINYKNSGLIEFITPAGQHNIKVVFEETALRLFSDFLSLASFICLLFILKFKLFKEEEK